MRVRVRVRAWVGQGSVIGLVIREHDPRRRTVVGLVGIACEATR